MANSDFLRHNLNQHTVKNSKSKKMDKDIDAAMKDLQADLGAKYPDLIFRHQKTFHLPDLIGYISKQHPEYKDKFGKSEKSSFISPDGGFLFAKNRKDDNEKIILVSEVKHQGTNDKRKAEGLPKQAKGNAIERLGKNLIGIRALFKDEPVLPFICFGNGYDFKPGSTILDRVLTMNDFFPLNTYYVEKTFAPFEPSSMFFRYEEWSKDEMKTMMEHVAEEAIRVYFGNNS